MYLTTSMVKLECKPWAGGWRFLRDLSIDVRGWTVQGSLWTDLSVVGEMVEM